MTFLEAMDNFITVYFRWYNFVFRYRGLPWGAFDLDYTAFMGWELYTNMEKCDFGVR